MENLIARMTFRILRCFMHKLLILIFLTGSLSPQIFSQPADQIMVGNDGVMRWRKDSMEVTGFGVNYTVPFAHAYRAGKKLGVDLKLAIDQDVYHFYRLGLDLFRVHVWDTEISDTSGNLLANEHLDLFDYLIFKLQERGIHAVITPIAYWGNGWPEPDLPTPGFSHKYGKDSCLVDPNAIKAQENYLRQFVNHVNKYTGKSYRDDPEVLAFEVCNEPHHKDTPEDVTAFVKKMVNAIRSTGSTKPVFYNVTHSIHLAEAYYNAGINGGTFQWYPTGLGFQKEIGGNMLPNVDRYTIPFEDVLKKNNSARFVYEFDAADMLTTYMYPAMARSFRTAGMQLATHFSYDPTYLAPYNTEYNTHYMNLVYAPRKALSLMICAEVFRHIPLYKDYGVHPDNTVFGPFRVSYEKDLADMVTDKKFIYTNHTNRKVPAPANLELIAGWGNSELIEYDGSGAYFLDRLGEAVWRLELMPDAIIYDNVFGQNNTETKRAALSYEHHQMKINLPEFNAGYAIQSIDWRDSVIYREVRGGETIPIKPGIYMIMGPEYEQGNAIVLESNKPIKMDEYCEPGTPIVSDKMPYAFKRKRQHSDKELVILDPTYAPWINRQWVRDSRTVTDSVANTTYMYSKLNGLSRRDGENLNAKPIGDYSMRHYFGDLVDDKKELASKTSITIEAYTPGDNTFPLQVALVMKDGSVFGTNIIIDTQKKKHTILLGDFGKVNGVLLPRPYPTFLPYYSVAGKSDGLNMEEVESLQLSIGPGIRESAWDDVYELMLGKVALVGE